MLNVSEWINSFILIHKTENIISKRKNTNNYDLFQIQNSYPSTCVQKKSKRAVY